MPMNICAEQERIQCKGTIGKAYQMYQERLKAADAMDFDDMICKTVELLQKIRMF